MITLKTLKEQVATNAPELKKEAKKIFSLKSPDLSYFVGITKSEHWNNNIHRIRVLQEIYKDTNFYAENKDGYFITEKNISDLYRIFWLFATIKGFDPKI
jgi:hypothetical protein